MSSLLELFCAVDDFWQAFEPIWCQQQLASGERKRQRRGVLSESEIMTIVIHCHQAGYRNFKTYYTEHVQVYLRQEFPHLVSYGRLIQLLPSILQPLYLPTKLLWHLYRDRVHRLDGLEDLRQPTDFQP